ncbi:hypothetical protein GQF03_04165 [Sneathiella chungangensis]|uniref:Uncharacterized protein n=1 Tax=Sneathiella chungangensis TaxID=1418234 RepID=A0A845MDZ7_9PROT|nr:hypothetical protein [Sneathiella chungangensis]MZR21516.1 hypothetical protein [Sneathiella chungangensis]
MGAPVAATCRRAGQCRGLSVKPAGFSFSLQRIILQRSEYSTILIVLNCGNELIGRDSQDVGQTNIKQSSTNLSLLSIFDAATY